MRKYVKILSILLSVVMLVGILAPMSALATLTLDPAQLGSNTKLTSKTDYALAPGITESAIITHNKDGSNQVKSWALEVDLSVPTTGILASYKDYMNNLTAPGTQQWGMQTVRAQASKAEAYHKAHTDPNFQVVGGVNGDFFNMGNGAPYGTFVMQGNVYNEYSGRPYFCITNDGTAEIRPAGTAPTNVKEAVAGVSIMVANGEVTDDARTNGYGPDQLPRTAVGIKADGSVVFLVADGRQAPTSCGHTFVQNAEELVALGCVTAMAMDGGGSSTFLSRREGSTGLACQNSPSDGSERTVSSALLVYSVATSDGSFDHAVISPKNKVYTPGSAVEFTAVGADGAGAPVDLPENGNLVLADDSFGTIENGVFTSNGKTGTVRVNYVVGELTRGSTTIDIQAPDELSFKIDPLTIALNQRTDLGLRVRYQGRDVEYKPGDFIWTPVVAPEYAAEYTSADMGHFEGNTFVASSDASVIGSITVTSAFDDSVTATLNQAIIGMRPKVVWDFEDPEAYKFSVAYMLPNGGIHSYLKQSPDDTMIICSYCDNGVGRGAVNDCEVVDIDSGEVRFGSHALKVYYDFENCVKPDGSQKIDGSCFGAFAGASAMDGFPTAIGLWMYAPEGTPNLWVRIRVYDEVQGAILTLNFTEQSKPASDGLGGINWTGWKYLEAPLTGSGKYSFMPGETVRLMFCDAAYGNGLKVATGATDPVTGKTPWKAISPAECKGFVYVDNVQFVYGSNTDDVDNPVIDTMTVADAASGEQITIQNENDTVVNSNDVELKTTFHDVQNDYTTGVDYENEAYRIYIDGKNVTEDAVVIPTEDTIRYYGTLANGVHTFKVLLRDGFGNETSETRAFTVNGPNVYPTITVSAVEDVCELNQGYTLRFSSDDAAQIAGFKTVLKVDQDFTDGYTATFAEGVTGTVTWNEKTGAFDIEAAGTPVSGDALLDIAFNVRTDLSEGKNFAYTVLEGSITFTDPTIVTDTFAGSQQTKRVSAAYTVTSDILTVGQTGAKFYVTDYYTGEPAADVAVYDLATNAVIGTSGADGSFVYDGYNAAETEFSVYAMKDGRYSFRYKYNSEVDAFAGTGAPQYVVPVTADDGATMIQIGWLSSVLDSAEPAIMQIAKKADYDANGEAAFANVNGESKIYKFDIYTARMKTAKATGLAPDCEYVYRVGDGAIWSDVGTAKTKQSGTDTNFWILGDTQAQADPATELVDTWHTIRAKAADGVDYDFGIQIGDSIEIANLYNLWIGMMEVYSSDELSSEPVLHVIGDHETFGDLEAKSTRYQLGLTDAQQRFNYSFTMGDVYVAVLQWDTTLSAEAFQEACDWLVEDAKNATATWKIVAIHSPPYPTNQVALIPWENEMLPKACDEAGINAVFAGHDHSFARTEPMTAGEVDEENGVVYYIVGNTCVKGYTRQLLDEYHFAYTESRNDYKSCYIQVTTTDDEMTISAYDVNGTNTRLMDSYTLQNKNNCAKVGHDFTMTGDGLVCSVCGYRGETLEGGKWTENKGDVYYIGADGTPVTGTQQIDGYTYTFTEDGKLTRYAFVLEDGTLKKNAWQNVEADYYYLGKDGLAITGSKKIHCVNSYVKSGKTITYENDYTYTFGPDGKLTQGVLVPFTKDNGYKGYKYVIAGVAQRGWYEIGGSWYYFDAVHGNDGDGHPAANNVKPYANADGTYTITKLSISRTYQFDGDCKLVKGFLETTDEGTSYYWPASQGASTVKCNVEKVTGLVEIDGATYYFDEDGFMVKGDSVLVDGKIISIASDGKVMTGHSGDHAYVPEVVKGYAATCTETGLSDGSICAECGFEGEKQVKLDKIAHVDADKNGKCDVCGQTVCKLDGEIHDGFFGGLIRFFHNLYYYFRALFGLNK